MNHHVKIGIKSTFKALRVNSGGILYDEKEGPLEPSFSADRSGLMIETQRKWLCIKGGGLAFCGILCGVTKGHHSRRLHWCSLWTRVQMSTTGINILFCNHWSSRASLCCSAGGRGALEVSAVQSKRAVVYSMDWSPAAPRFFLGDSHFQLLQMWLEIERRRPGNQSWCYTPQAGELISAGIAMLRLYTIPHSNTSRVLLDGIVRANEGCDESVEEPGRKVWKHSRGIL